MPGRSPGRRPPPVPAPPGHASPPAFRCTAWPTLGLRCTRLTIYVVNMSTVRERPGVWLIQYVWMRWPGTVLLHGTDHATARRVRWWSGPGPGACVAGLAG